MYFIPTGPTGPCKRAAGKATWPLREFVLVISTTENIIHCNSFVMEEVPDLAIFILAPVTGRLHVP